MSRWRRVPPLLGAAGIVLMLLVSAFAATQRYVFHTTGAWVAEIEQYLLLFTVFIVAGSTYAEDGHVSAGMVVRLLPIQGRKLSTVAIDLVGLAFCAFMLWEGVQKVMQLHAAHIKSGTSLQTPLYLVASLLPLSMLLLGIAIASRLVSRMRRA